MGQKTIGASVWRGATWGPPRAGRRLSASLVSNCLHLCSLNRTTFEISNRMVSQLLDFINDRTFVG